MNALAKRGRCRYGGRVTTPLVPTTLARDGAAWVLAVGAPLDLALLEGPLALALDHVERDVGAGVVVTAARSDGALGDGDPAAIRADPAAHGRALQAQLARLARLPSVAAVHGSASGAGACLALACRALAMSAGATLAWPEVTVGLVPAGGSCWRLPRRMGLVAALPHLVGAPLHRDRAVDTRLALALPARDPSELVGAALATLTALPPKPPRPRQALGLAIAAQLRPFRGTIFRAAERHLPPPLRGTPAAIAALRGAAIGWEQGPTEADAFAIAANENLCRAAAAPGPTSR